VRGGNRRFEYNLNWSGWRFDGAAQDVGNFCIGIEDRGTESKRIRDKRTVCGLVLKQMEHVFGGLLEIGITGDGGKCNLFREKIDFEDIAFVHSVGEVTLPATVVFERGTNIPTNRAVFTEGGAGFSRGMGDDLGSHGGNRSAIEIELAEE
jgi:hypothetical protein